MLSPHLKQSIHNVATRICTVIVVALAPVIIFQRNTRKKFGLPIKSLWAGTPILTLPIKANSERLLGVSANSLVFDSYYITRDFHINLSRVMAIPVVSFFMRYLVFLWACFSYDRLHFFLDRGLLLPSLLRGFNKLEISVYRELGKQIFFWTYGADVRTVLATKALGEPNCCTMCPCPGKTCVCNDAWGKENIGNVMKYANAVFSMGDMIEYTPGSRNDLFFWPVDLNNNKYSPYYPSRINSGPVKIVHAPNHREFKGTQLLIEAFNVLKNEGHNVELQLVEGISNDLALEIYRTADIIFDQCMIGFHGYFALEGMAMGKPVACFIRKPESYLLNYEECPIVNIHASSLVNDLRDLIKDRQRLYELGLRGRQYVENYFSMPAFAKRLNQAYTDLGISS